jgi:hypothetical protein
MIAASEARKHRSVGTECHAPYRWNGVPQKSFFTAAQCAPSNCDLGRIGVPERTPDRCVVLVVEDEPLIMMNAVDILHAESFDTIEATSAADFTE